MRQVDVRPHIFYFALCLLGHRAPALAKACRTICTRAGHAAADLWEPVACFVGEHAAVCSAGKAACS